MPVIGLEPNEANPQSLFPKSLVKAATQIKNFERETSADFLISPLSLSLPSIIDDKVINRVKLHKHCQAGCLVQRKSGNDLLASIKKLPFILGRMLAWCPHSYLLAIGSFYPAKDGKVICNGRKTKWNYSSYTGALQSWVDQGGKLRFLWHDDDITGWIATMQRKLKAVQQGKAKYVTRQFQKVVSPDSKDAFKNWLRAINGIGPIRAHSLGDHCGSYIWSLIFATDPANGGLCGLPTPTIHRIRKAIGLKEGQYIHIADHKFE